MYPFYDPGQENIKNMHARMHANMPADTQIAVNIIRIITEPYFLPKYNGEDLMLRLLFSNEPNERRRKLLLHCHLFSRCAPMVI